MAMTSRAHARLFVVFLLVAPALSAACHGDDQATHPLAPPDPPSSNPSAPGTRLDPADVGAGHVDSRPLPPLADTPGVYAPADEGPVIVSVTVQDARAFAAVEAGDAGARAPITFAAADAGDGRAPAS